MLLVYKYIKLLDNLAESFYLSFTFVDSLNPICQIQFYANLRVSENLHTTFWCANFWLVVTCTAVRIYWKWATLKYCPTLKIVFIHYRTLEISVRDCVSSLLSTQYSTFLFTGPFNLARARAFIKHIIDKDPINSTVLVSMQII